MLRFLGFGEIDEKVYHVTVSGVWVRMVKVSHVTVSGVWGRRENVSHVTVSGVRGVKGKGVPCYGFWGLGREGGKGVTCYGF